jgi:hypothetical protein
MESQPTEYQGNNKYTAGEVIRESFRILRDRPSFFIPQVIAWGIEFSFLLILAPILMPILMPYLSDLSAEQTAESIPKWFWYAVAAGSLAIILAESWITGVYPLLVKSAVEGKTSNLTEAFKEARSRLLSLLGATLAYGGLLLLAIFVGSAMLGFVPFLGLPLILFLTFYLTTVFYHFAPALMLEDRAALNSLSRSSEYASGKKWSILGLVLFIMILASVSSLLGLIPYVGSALAFVATMIITCLERIMPSYGFLKFPSSAPEPYCQENQGNKENYTS